MITAQPVLRTISVPTPFAVGNVNLYLLEGTPLTLLDVGPNTPEAYEALEMGLKQYGYQISDIEQIILSHHHTDHIGLVERIARIADAPIVTHPYTKPFIETPQEARLRHDAFFRQICAEANVPHEMLSTIERTNAWILRFSNLPIPVARTIDEGDTILAGDTKWHVYHTPGHAGDLICLYDPTSGTLLASDHLILKISSNPVIEPSPNESGTRPRRLLEYIHHMKRIAELHPQIAYSGHGRPIQDVMSLVETRIAHHRARAEKIYTYFSDGPAHLWDITERMYGHISQSEKFLALSEVLGHIDLLEAEGRLVREYYQSVVYWHQA
ncbi:MAG: hypothetical protein CUN55_03480 [Phototrophicales bacterium]|nr:MAG: hypothetical protein CUN55_03480 [Phototrophicales bacterium]